ncbi:MAG: type II toxin-antitoxin system HicB family antitoxin [Candidatus Njordarchaeia archaeon]
MGAGEELNKGLGKEFSFKRLTVIIEKDEDGYYVAEVKELPGCFTQAKTIGGLLEGLREAIGLYIETVQALPDKPKL